MNLSRGIKTPTPLSYTGLTISQLIWMIHGSAENSYPRVSRGHFF